MKPRHIQTNWQTNFSLLLTLLNVFALLLLSNPTVDAAKIYWTSRRGIHRADLEDKSLETFLPVTLSSPGHIAVDAGSGKIYWTDTDYPGKIQRVNLDGTNVEELVTGLVEPRYIALDLTLSSDVLISVEPQGKQPVLWGRLRQNALLQNSPNPFNSETWIPFHLAQEADVTIQIYDMRGQIVRTLSLGTLTAGYYDDRFKAAYWDGKWEMGEVVSSGIYFYHLKAGDYSAVRRMTIIK